MSCHQSASAISPTLTDRVAGGDRLDRRLFTVDRSAAAPGLTAFGAAEASGEEEDDGDDPDAEDGHLRRTDGNAGSENQRAEQEEEGKAFPLDDRSRAARAEEIARLGPPCPRCGSTDTSRAAHRRLKAATLLASPILLLWPFVAKHECDACGAKW